MLRRRGACGGVQCRLLRGSCTRLRRRLGHRLLLLELLLELTTRVLELTTRQAANAPGQRARQPTRQANARARQAPAQQPGGAAPAAPSRQLQDNRPTRQAANAPGQRARQPTRQANAPRATRRAPDVRAQPSGSSSTNSNFSWHRPACCVVGAGGRRQRCGEPHAEPSLLGRQHKVRCRTLPKTSAQGIARTRAGHHKSCLLGIACLLGILIVKQHTSLSCCK